MLEFYNIRIEDKEWVKPLLALSDFRGCEYTFGNNFLWSDAYDIKISRYKDFYLVKSGDGFFYPAGQGDIAEVIDILKAYCRSRSIPFRIISSPKVGMERLKEMYGDKINVTSKEDYFDYCYNYNDLSFLAGKKFHSKRNFINRFETHSWTYEEISSDNISECYNILELWSKENLANESAAIAEEVSVTAKGLDNFFSLDFSGGLLKAEGIPVAFTYGEHLNSDTFDVHVEKALSLYDGAYPMINKQFVSRLDNGYKYINREEDMGEENLRKAKRSYHPAFMEEKFIISFKD